MKLRALLVAAAAGASVVAGKTPRALSPYPLQGVVDAARAAAATTPLVQGTGLTETDYLRVIHGIVTWFLPYQAANGSIIDPYAREEIQYATPCFAFSSALLVDTGYDTTLLDASARALDSALSQLSNGTCASGHNNFFTFPAFMAYQTLKTKVDASRVAMWQFYLNNINPAHYVNLGMNWGLVAAGGEFARVVVGGFGGNKYNSSQWWQHEFDMQVGESLLTASGNYEDHSGSDGLNPLPYDTFPLKYLAVMLEQGYGAGNYTYSGLLTTLLDRAAWTHMAQLSPRGEVMTGGRSSQHTWNEAASTTIFEIYAAKYAAAGDAQVACMFRRSAHKALESVGRWVYNASRAQIVKNWHPPVERFGYEEYSFLSNYNLLPAAQMAAAYQFAVGAKGVPECTTFSDVGGFVFGLPELNVIAANAGGTYIEIETAADPNYDATGLMRMHVNNCGTVGGGCMSPYSLLGPSSPAQQNFWGTRQAGAVSAAGVWWSLSTDAPGVVRRLGNATYKDVAATVLTPAWNNTPGSVVFTVDYVLLAQATLVTETYSVSSGGGVSVSAGVTLVAPAELVAWMERVAAVASRVPGSTGDSVQPATRTLVSLPAESRPTPPTGSAGPLHLEGAPVSIVSFGVGFLALLSDGANTTTLGFAPGMTNGSATVSLPGAGSQTFSMAPAPPGKEYSWALDAAANMVLTRNGNATVVDVTLTPLPKDSTHETISYSLQMAAV